MAKEPDPTGGDQLGDAGREDPKPAVPIKVGKVEFDQPAVEAMVAENKQLKEYREHGRRLMLSDGTFDDGREESVRYLMTDAHFEADVINSYVDAQKNPAAEGEGEEPEGEVEPVKKPAANPKPALKRGETAASVESQELKDLRERLDVVEEKEKERRGDRLEEKLGGAVAAALDGSPDIDKMLERAKALGKDSEDADGRQGRTFLEQLVRQETATLLRRRQASGGVYQERWLEEEAARAAKSVASKFRSVIGDPALLGRSPETVAGDDEFARKDPPKKPEWVKGEGPPEVMTKSRDYTENTLLQIAHEASQGGETRA